MLLPDILFDLHVASGTSLFSTAALSPLRNSDHRGHPLSTCRIRGIRNNSFSENFAYVLYGCPLKSVSTDYSFNLEINGCSASSINLLVFLDTDWIVF